MYRPADLLDGRPPPASQIDLGSASIRPGRPGAWFDILRQRVLDAASGSSSESTAFSGTWQHDIDQANLLPQDKVHYIIYNHDSP